MTININRLKCTFLFSYNDQNISTHVALKQELIISLKCKLSATEIEVRNEGLNVTATLQRLSFLRLKNDATKSIAQKSNWRNTPPITINLRTNPNINKRHT